MPIITLEVLSDSSRGEFPSENTAEVQQDTFDSIDETGVHFLTEKSQENEHNNKAQETKEAPKPRQNFLEYMLRNDGSVICKLCGEILQSRTHWYRHKYKLHVMQPLNPAPLFQCEQCLIYFKSRKGYIGHIASKHSEVLSDSSPVLTNAQAEELSRQANTVQVGEEVDPEMAIPKSSVPNYQNNNKQSKNASTSATESKRASRANRGDLNNKPEPNLEDRRSQEEKLVADIINRVRRECEAQGSSGPTRKGYNRRTTVMHTQL